MNFLTVFCLLLIATNAVAFTLRNSRSMHPDELDATYESDMTSLGRLRMNYVYHHYSKNDRSKQMEGPCQVECQPRYKSRLESAAKNTHIRNLNPQDCMNEYTS